MSEESLWAGERTGLKKLTRSCLDQLDLKCRGRLYLHVKRRQPVVYVVCPVCGNKRCPKAKDHKMVCTMSNDLDQVGVQSDNYEVVHKSGRYQARCGARSQSGMIVTFDYRRVTCEYCLRGIKRHDIESVMERYKKENNLGN